MGAKISDHDLATLLDALEQDRICARCGETYRANEAGALLCRYHPFRFRSRGLRHEPYARPLERRLGLPDDRAPAPCEICNTNHLRGESRYLANQGRVPGLLAAGMAKNGCVALDHSSAGVASLLARPFVAVPFFVWDRLLISKKRDRNAFTQRNTIVVDKAPQMNLSLRVVIPGTAELFVRTVQDIYCEMARIYKLGDLDSEVRLARRGPNASSITRIHKRHDNDERLEVHRLHGSNRRSNISFTPFVIVVRVAQPMPVELVDRPDLLHIIADDQLI